MDLNLTGSVNSYWQYYRTTQKSASQKAANALHAGSALQTSKMQKAQSAGFTLHIGSGDSTDRMLSAVAGRGSGGMTVFEPADFNPGQPVYKVCTWDKDGNMTAAT